MGERVKATIVYIESKLIGIYNHTANYIDSEYEKKQMQQKITHLHGMAGELR